MNHELMLGLLLHTFCLIFKDFVHGRNSTLAIVSFGFSWQCILVHISSLIPALASKGTVKASTIFSGKTNGCCEFSVMLCYVCSTHFFSEYVVQFLVHVDLVRNIFFSKLPLHFRLLDLCWKKWFWPGLERFGFVG